MGELPSRDSGGKKGKPANVNLRKDQSIPAMFAVNAVHPALAYTAIAQCTTLSAHTNEGGRFVESDDSHRASKCGAAGLKYLRGSV